MVKPKIKVGIHSIANIPKRILLMEAAPSETSVNPTIAATIAIRRKIADHLSMTHMYLV